MGNCVHPALEEGVEADSSSYETYVASSSSVSDLQDDYLLVDDGWVADLGDIETTPRFNIVGKFRGVCKSVYDGDTFDVVFSFRGKA